MWPFTVIPQSRLWNQTRKQGDQCKRRLFKSQLWGGRRPGAVYGYRYYSPQIGRGLSRDPIGEEGGVNLYNFVGNDPVGKFDLLGMIELTFAYITRIEPARITFMGSTFNGGIKTTQTVSVDPDQCTITFSSKSIGRTIKYASPTGPAVATARVFGEAPQADFFCCAML